MIRVRVVGVALDPAQQHVILLTPLDPLADGERVLPVWIGPQEAMSILVAIEGTSSPRPLAHDLMTAMLGELSASVSRVEITHLDEGTFVGSVQVPPGVTLDGSGPGTRFETRDDEPTILIDGEMVPDDAPGLVVVPGSAGGPTTIRNMTVVVRGGFGIVARGEGAILIEDVRVEVQRGIGIGMERLTEATLTRVDVDGPVDPDRVLEIACDPRTDGAADIVLADTLGQAVPGQVAELIARVRTESPARRIVYHGHDTWGLGVANSLAAVSAGASVVDGALAGLGGCPFAPGASGNTATEDLLFATRPQWLSPDVFADLVRLGEDLVAELDEPNRARATQGARSEAAAFEWVLRS